MSGDGGWRGKGYTRSSGTAPLRRRGTGGIALGCRGKSPPFLLAYPPSGNRVVSKVSLRAAPPGLLRRRRLRAVPSLPRGNRGSDRSLPEAGLGWLESLRRLGGKSRWIGWGGGLLGGLRKGDEQIQSRQGCSQPRTRASPEELDSHTFTRLSKREGCLVVFDGLATNLSLVWSKPKLRAYQAPSYGIGA